MRIPSDNTGSGSSSVVSQIPYRQVEGLDMQRKRLRVEKMQMRLAGEELSDITLLEDGGTRAMRWTVWTSNYQLPTT